MLSKLKEILFEWPDPDEKAIESADKSYDSLLEEFKTLDYPLYLRTKHWLHFQDEALKKAGFKCQACTKDSTALSVHHRSYDNLGRETFNDVIVLCEACRINFQSEKKVRKDV